MVAGCVVLTTSCGGDDDEAVRPVVDQIAPAIAAVESELGGPQQFFEINATPQVVNLFVATDGGTMVTPYVYVGGEVASPAEPTTAEGATFVADAVTFDAATILDGVTDELPDSDVARLSIVGGPGGAVRYGATVQSDAGGTLEIVLGPDGTVQSVDPGGDEASQIWAGSVSVSGRIRPDTDPAQMGGDA